MGGKPLCEPASIAGAAMIIGSTLLSQQAASKVQKARNSASSAEALRQEDFRRQQAAAFDTTSEGFTRKRQDEGINTAALAREESLGGNLKGFSPGDVPTTGSAPKIVQENLAKELSRSLGEGKDFAKRLARFGAVGENQFGNTVTLGRGAQDQARLGGFSAGSSSILPLEFQAANQKGAGLSTAAGILGGLGSAANVAGATGGLTFGSATGESAFPNLLRPVPPLPLRKPVIPPVAGIPGTI